MRIKATLVMIALLAVAQALAAQAPAAASGAGGEKIGIINIQTAIQSSQEGKKAVANLATQFSPKRIELQNESKQIQAMQKQLQDGGNTLSPDAKAELSRTIESKQKDLQRAYEDAQSDFQNAQNDAVNRIGTKMMKIIDDYAQQHGFSLILDVSSPQTPVLFAAKTINITPEIVRLYDRQYPVVAAAAKPAPSQP